MAIEKQYEWLLKEGAPKILVEALKLYGIKEKIGPANNPEILRWAKVTGLDKDYKADATPWCGLFICYVCYMAGKPTVKNPLWALNWANWGTEVDVPMLGDIVTFKRYNSVGKLIGGHVGILVGETAKTYFVLGGNQDDKVCVAELDKGRFFKARRTSWSVAQPNNIRQVVLTASGTLSNNEA